jgi:hypothetical protein
MSRHGTPGNHRCVWCSRWFETPQLRATHEHLIHRGNIQRTQEAQAAAALQHYHQDRMATLRGRAS